MINLKAARAFGYTPKQIIGFIQGQKGFGSRITAAMAYGYTADQIYKFLSSGTSSKNKKGALASAIDPELEAKDRAKNARSTLEKLLDPVVTGGTLAGVGIGAALGGPVGAVMGGSGANVGLQDILNRYEEAVYKGGSLDFNDFIQSAAKGVGAGAIAGAGARAAGLGAAAQAAAPGMAPTGLQYPGQPAQQVPPAQIQDQSIPMDQPTAEVPPAEAAPVAPVASGLGPMEALQEMQQAGVLPIITQLAQQGLTPQEIRSAITRLYGDKWPKEVEKKFLKPFESVLGEALQAAQTAEASQPTLPSEAPTPVSAGSAQQRDLFEDTLQNLGYYDQGRDGIGKKAEEIKALLSSNVRGLEYDPQSQVLRSLFGSGAAYEYPGVPQDIADKVFGAEGVTKTAGESVYRAFPKGKEGSFGAAFNELIKKPKTEKDELKYPHRQMEPEEYSEEFKKVSGADKVFRASQAVSSFLELTEKAKSKQRGESDRSKFAKLMDLEPEQNDAIHFMASFMLKKMGKKRTKKAMETMIDQYLKKLNG